jgi:hypothetical protein
VSQGELQLRRSWHVLSGQRPGNNWPTSLGLPSSAFCVSICTFVPVKQVR